jgi:hypothetical protein
MLESEFSFDSRYCNMSEINNIEWILLVESIKVKGKFFSMLNKVQRHNAESIT